MESVIELKIEALGIENKDRPLVRMHYDPKATGNIYKFLIHISK